MLLWSTHSFKELKTIDESFVRILLLSCVHEKELKMGEVKNDVMIFIEGRYLFFIISFWHNFCKQSDITSRSLSNPCEQ